MGLLAVTGLGILTVALVATAQGNSEKVGLANSTPGPEELNFRLTASFNLTAISNYQTFRALREAGLLTPTVDYSKLSPPELSRIGQLTYQTAQCNIKGNITLDTPPLKRYHIKIQNYYDSVVIEPEQGERWFCTEEDAVNNGWQKSRE